MNILVLGSGGREHAIAWALRKSPKVEKLYVAPGNGGTEQVAENVRGLAIEDGEAVLAFAKDHDIDLVVIGPEAPLVAGVADVVRAGGINVFGPDAQGAQLEGSKTYSKEFMDANGIPTARYGSFTNAEEALAFAREMGAPLVVKADGLAAGKGVVVAETMEDAEEAIEACFEGSFGDAGSKVVIEECLTGPECSLLAFVSNGQAHCMVTAQDHKRAYEGDRGPNTGGMGAYSPVPIVEADELAAMREIMEQAAAATSAEHFDQDYRGVLYGGFMLTPEGPKVLEFNARFGDPETQVVLPRLESDLADIMVAVADEKGKVILGIDEAEDLKGVTVFHAGTAKNHDDELVTSGGRVLNVVALGNSFEQAQQRAYEACDLINFEGKQLRTDIGDKAAKGRSAWE